MRFLTWILFLTVTASQAGAESLEMRSARRAFLLDNKDRVTMMFDINHVHILHLLRCLEEVMTDEQFAAAKITDPNTSKPWQNCNDGVAQMKEVIRLVYPDMRRTLLLSQLLTKSSLDMLLRQLWMNVYSNKQDSVQVLSSAGWMNRDLVTDNPLSAWLSPEELPAPPWTKQEIESVLNDTSGKNDKEQDFNNLFKQGCARANARMRFDFCNFTRLRISEKTGGIYLSYEGTESAERKTRSEIENARSFLPDELRKIQTQFEDRFKATVQENPYVALVTSASPAREDLVKALHIMVVRSQASIIEHANFVTKHHLNDREQADEDALISLMKYTPVAKNVADDPGPEMKRVMKLMPLVSANEVLDSLMSSLFYQQLEETGIEIGKFIGINVLACWIPVSRAVGFVGKSALKLVKLQRVSELFTAAQGTRFMKEMFSPICYGVGGFFVNVGMLYGGIREYGEVYRQVFGSVEEKTLLRDVNGLSEKEREIFWTFVSVPVGTGALKLVKKLPEGIWQTAERAAARVQMAY